MYKKKKKKKYSIHLFGVFHFEFVGLAAEAKPYDITGSQSDGSILDAAVVDVRALGCV